jgi:hypothetical protein
MWESENQDESPLMTTDNFHGIDRLVIHITWTWSRPFARGSALTPFELNDNALGSRRYPRSLKATHHNTVKKYCLYK